MGGAAGEGLPAGPVGEDGGKGANGDEGSAPDERLTVPVDAVRCDGESVGGLFTPAGAGDSTGLGCRVRAVTPPTSRTTIISSR